MRRRPDVPLRFRIGRCRFDPRRPPSRALPLATGLVRPWPPPPRSRLVLVLADDHSTIQPNFQRASSEVDWTEFYAIIASIVQCLEPIFPIRRFRPVLRGFAVEPAVSVVSAWLVSTDPIVPPPRRRSTPHREIRRFARKRMLQAPFSYRFTVTLNFFGGHGIAAIRLRGFHRGLADPRSLWGESPRRRSEWVIRIR